MARTWAAVACTVAFVLLVPRGSSLGTQEAAAARTAAVTSAAPQRSCAGAANKPPVYLIGLPARPITAVQFISARQGWVVGTAGILATSDGGGQWEVQYRGHEPLQEVDFVNPCRSFYGRLRRCRGLTG